MLAEAVEDDSDLNDLLGPGPLRQARLDLTTRCNLRCVYCAVSQPGYAGRDMAPGLAARAASLIAAYAQYQPIATISVNGHGETTYAEGWTDQVAPLLDAGLPVCLTSNLARAFDAAELSCLSAFRNIAVSIDTADPVLLARMRRKVDLARIVRNIEAIRRTAERAGRRGPNITFISGLYHPCALSVVPLAEMAIVLGVRRVAFWDLRKYDDSGLGLSADQTATPLAALDAPTLQACLDRIAEAVRLLAGHGIAVDVPADFIAVLARRRGLAYAP